MYGQIVKVIWGTEMKTGLAVANVVRASVLGGLFGCLLPLHGYAQSSALSSPHYVMDAKEARAMAAQLEHRKVIVYQAVSDFEKSLSAGNLADCERRLDQSPELSAHGVRVKNCTELLPEKDRTAGARTKLKLRNHAVELTPTGARVTVDVLPLNERHILDLREVHVRDHWLVTSFMSTANQ